MKAKKTKVQLKKSFGLYTILGVILLTTTLFGSCSNNNEDLTPISDIDMINQLPLEPLSEMEKSSLIFMREEEKLARDVYLYLYNQWNLAVFNNIASSEQSHTDAVLALLNKYSIDDPVSTDEIGVFANEDLQTLYNQLITQGSGSLLDSLIVGATIEDLDIYDLNTASEQLDNQDILMIYVNLTKGSRNHMRSFYNQILMQNGTYEPQYISEAEFEAIINSAMERGQN